MVDVTLATLAMGFNVDEADPARRQTDALRASTRALEEQAKATTAAMRDHAVSQGLSGTAAGKAVQAMAPLVGAWGQARDSLGRFTAADGSFRMSQDLTAKMLLQNANAATAYARQQDQAAKAVAKAEAEAAREAQAAWKQSQAIQAEIMRERVALARVAEREESQAARAAAKAIEDADRAAERSAQEVTSFRIRMTRQRAAEEASAAQEQIRAAATTASYAAKFDNLRASLDPFAAVQVRLAQNTRLLDEALAHGAISARQYEDALSQVTRAATNGLLGIDKYSSGLKNGGQYATQFSFQLNDIVTGLVSGQKPMQIFAQQGGQVFQILQMAALEAGSFKGAIRSLTAQVLPFIATFGPWIAGLAAVGAAVWYVVDQENKHAKAIDDATKRLDEQRKSLGQISPLLNQAKMDADLAADGQKNFDEWLRKTNVSLAEQIRLQRIKTLNDTNEAALKAGEELRKAQEQFDKLNKPGTQMGFSTGVGAFSTISAATTINKESETFKKAAKNLKEAQDDVDRLNQRLAKQGQVPDTWFDKYAESANRATTAVRQVASATEDYGRRAAPIEESALIKAAEIYWPEAAAAAEAYKKQQDAVKAATDSSIKTFDEQTRGLVRMSSALESLAVDFEDAARQAYGIRASIEDIGYAIKNGDWTGAFAGLFSALDQVQKAFADGATSAQKFAAISGIGQGVGSLIGGKTGAAISGAASGAQAGFQLGGPWGAAAGAALGGLTSILGSSAAKAEAKMEALRNSVEALRTDNKTSSGSISGALEEANKAWNADLEYSSAMVTSLRSIDNQIGALANALARQISGGSLMSTKGLGIGSTSSQGSLATGIGAAGLTGAALAGGTSLLLSGFAGALALGPIGLVAGAVGALVGALTKTKKTTEVLDQGLQFTASTFDEITKGGVTGSSYADLVTTTKKSLLGIGLSTKVSNSTVNGAIDPSLLGQINGIIEALGNGVLSAASVFGVEAAKAAETALGSAMVDLGKLSLKDLKPDEIAAVLQATFDKVGDQLAAAGVPGLDKLATVGEGSFETLTRLAREYQVVDTSLAALGKTFGMVGVESLAARDNLVQLFGGLDAFTSATSFFASNFLTDAEQLAPVIKAVNDNLKAYGLSAESSRDTFKALVLAQDLTTEAGRATYAALLAIAPAFDKVSKSAEDATKAANDNAAALAAADAEAAAKGFNAELERQNSAMAAAADAENTRTSALQASNQALGDSIRQLDELAKSLDDFANSLNFGDLSGNTLGSQYDFAKQNLLSAKGDQIPEAAKAFLDISKQRAGTSLEYGRDVALAQSVARAGSSAALTQIENIKAFAPLFAAMASGNQAEIDRLMRGAPTGFATGGSFTVGGAGAPDSKLFNLALSPGEMVDVRRPGASSNDNSQVAALKDQIVAMRADFSKALTELKAEVQQSSKVLKNVSPDGDSLQVKLVS